MTEVPSVGLKHLAVIMDGNGRWAEQRALPRLRGHSKGYEAFLLLVDYALKKSIPELTVFTLSSENLARPWVEVDHLFTLFLHAVEKESRQLRARGIRVCVVGNFTLLPPRVQEAIAHLHAIDIPEPRMQLNVCFAYGGQWHIESAFERCQAEGGDLQRFRALLQAPFLHPVDFLIRSGGVMRISNFALWPIAYAECLFLEEYWPDVDDAVLDRCLEDFFKRQRRFGQVT